MNNESKYQIPFNEYLQNDKENFSIIISKGQYAIEIGKIPCKELTKDLITKTRPDIIVDDNISAVSQDIKFTDSNIIISGYPGYIELILPEKELLSTKQFDCLKEILLSIKEKNKEEFGYKYSLVAFGNGIIKVEPKDYSDGIDLLIEKLENYVMPIDYVFNETIIGRCLITKVITEKDLDSMIENMANNPKTVERKLENFSLRGYSTVFIVGLITLISSLLIIVLGIVLDTL